MDAGLVEGEGFAVDASVIEADASRYHGKAPGEIDWSAPERQTRAVAEFLTALDDEDADAARKPPKVMSSSFKMLILSMIRVIIPNCSAQSKKASPTWYTDRDSWVARAGPFSIGIWSRTRS